MVRVQRITFFYIFALSNKKKYMASLHYLSTHFQKCSRKSGVLPKTLFAIASAWTNIVDLSVSTLDETDYIIKFTTYENL